MKIGIRTAAKTAAEAFKGSCYVNYFGRCRIDKQLVILDSKHGEDIAGNILALGYELYKSYPGMKLCFSCTGASKERIAAVLRSKGVKRFTLADISSLSFYKLLSQAGYIFTDTSLPMRYIKKPGQTVVNTWHGTPLKVMGRDIPDSIYSMGNIQRNLLFSDYILFQSEFMRDRMVSAFDLDGLYKGKLLLSGYPRCSVLLNERQAAVTKKRAGLSGKRVYIYMPTWRGTGSSIKSADQVRDTEALLTELDSMLSDDEVLIAKLHPFVKDKLELSGFRHITEPGESVGTYELLACSDALITDYSSVMFDYAVSRKKIVLYAPDEQKYLAERGLYFPLSELPFPRADTAAELIYELKSARQYDDSAFIERFCPFESKDAAAKLLAHVIDGKKLCREESIYDRSKQNVLIYAGTLAANGITTAAVSMLENTDLEKRRYIVTFRQDDAKNYPLRCGLIPRGAKVMPMCTKLQFTVREAIAMGLYYGLGFRPALKTVERLCKRDAERFFGSIDIDRSIQFEGYGKNMIHLFRLLGCPSAIFVHNDMQQELARKKIQHRPSLERAYRSYDAVCCVTEDIVPPTREIAGEDANITVVENCLNYQSIIERSKEPLHFDEDTVSTVSEKELSKLLASDRLKFITIGRFAYEKGHDMLIEAFERFTAEHPDSALIIIGGYGELCDQTLALAKASPAADKIIVIRSVQNPMPILAKCDLFILSSRYEALGLTVLEADVLGVPVIAADIPGPRGFMTEHGGTLVSPDPEGLYRGMTDFTKGLVKPMNADYEFRNIQAAAAFEALLTDKMTERQET